ncbi:MAG: hypothetical protein AB7U61_04605 [Methylocystis sp.]
MERKELLRHISFGSQVAEDERRELATYFVETDQWRRIANNEIDIIRGEKGSGKSAIYSLLTERESIFFQRKTILVAGENPRGDTVFRGLVTEPPASEAEFIILWKLYIIAIIAKDMRKNNIIGEARKVYLLLEDEGLLESDNSLSSLLAAVQRKVRALMRSLKIENDTTVDELTGLPKLETKISIGEPLPEAKRRGSLSLDDMLSALSAELVRQNYNVWVMLDRLDVAFTENHDLEANALRALMRVYGDLKGFDNIYMKIFIREDIWKRITEGGFREASHIVRYVLLDWNTSSLLNLLMKRVLSNNEIVDQFNINRDDVLSNVANQERLFETLFPSQIEQGPQKAKTLKWMITRCADGTKKTAPRELIHLLNCLREEEAKRLEQGGMLPPGNELFDRSVFKKALPIVSKARLNQYLYAEYPQERSIVSQLDGQKTEQTPRSLSDLWGCTDVQAISKARNLVELGFFEERGTRDAPTFWVPFLYRDALNMIQGKAGEILRVEDLEEE